MHLYISNIGSLVTIESLHAVFSTYGTIQNINLVKASDVSPHSAHIEMADEEEAKRAMLMLGGCIINGCNLSVIAG